MLRGGVLLWVVAVATLGPAASASAGPPGSWTRVTETNLVNFAEPAMARTADGRLHFVYHHPIGPLSEELLHTSVAPTGAWVGGRDVVQTGWTSLNQRPALVRTPDGGMRLFFGGLHSTVTGDPLNEFTFTIAAGADGRSWSAPQRVGAGDDVRISPATMAAAVTRDGNFVLAQADPGNLVHFGIGGGPTFPFESCCSYDPGIGVDAVTGEVVVGWFAYVPGDPGLFVRGISPSGLVGPRTVVPGTVVGGSAIQPLQRTPVTGRIGAPGVYVAYGAGYPSYTSVNLFQVGGGSTVVARAGGTGAQNVNLAPAPEGRLWVMWGVSGRYFATRSNRAATRFGPVTSIAPPSGTVSTFGLWGEGSLGKLDLLAETGTVSNQVGFWHTQVLPPLDVTAPKSAAIPAAKGAKAGVTVRVTDAGDPVAGVRVTFAGQTRTTNAQGAARFNIARGGTFRAVAQHAGYRRDTAPVKVRKKKPKRR